VQDYIAEATTEPLPGTREMPETVVKVSADAIKLSYQIDRRDVLTLPPIARA
jgi:hypothetical protein